MGDEKRREQSIIAKAKRAIGETHDADRLLAATEALTAAEDRLADIERRSKEIRFGPSASANPAHLAAAYSLPESVDEAIGQRLRDRGEPAVWLDWNLSGWRRWTSLDEHLDDEEAISADYPEAWDLVVAAVDHNAELASRQAQADKAAQAASGISLPGLAAARSSAGSRR